MMMRISRDEWGLQIAEVTALRGTCLRRLVGCVLMDAHGVVLATGYNGVPRGVNHCNDPTSWNFVYGNGIDRSRPLTGQSTGIENVYGHACLGRDAPSGTELDACMATHAEMNAIAQCADVNRIHTCYTTTEPCVSCTKMLMNTGCRRVVFRKSYPHKSAELWLSRALAVGDANYEWLYIPETA